MTRLSDKLEAAMKAGTQGEWSVDTVQSDGEYGSGPDAHSGFHVLYRKFERARHDYQPETGTRCFRSGVL